MDVSGIGALSSYTYQSTLTQTGSTGQALAQAMAASQSEVANATSLLSGAGSMDSLFALAGASGSQALGPLATLAYGASGASGAPGASPSPGEGPTAVQNIQAMLASLAGGSPGLFSSASTPSSSDSLPVSAAALSPATTEALVRYAYDQSQNPTNTAAQAAASGQRTQQSSGLNLLA